MRGVIVSLGGQTPLKLAHALERSGIPVLGTSPASIDAAEDREQFNALVRPARASRSPTGRWPRPPTKRVAVANEIGYPVLVRPSYVLGGRAMQIVYDDADVGARWPSSRTRDRSDARAGSRPNARRSSTGSSRTRSRSTSTRCATTRGACLIGGVMEHTEEAGVHSGDSSCAIPPPTLAGRRRAHDRGVHRARSPPSSTCVGLLNVQYAVQRPACLRHRGRTRARAARCRSSARRPACRSPRSRRGSWSGATLDELRDRRAAAAARRRSARRGQGGGAAVQPLPRRRHDPRAGDAFHRRGHGHRPQLRHGVREESGGRRQPAAARGHGLLVARRPRQGRRDLRGPPLLRPRVLDRRDRGHGPLPRGRAACGSTRSSPRSARTSASTRSTSSPRARSTS